MLINNLIGGIICACVTSDKHLTRTLITSVSGGDRGIKPRERESVLLAAPLLLSSEGDTLPHQSHNSGLLVRRSEAGGTVQTPALTFNYTFRDRFIVISERAVIIKANKAPRRLLTPTSYRSALP